MTNNAKHTFNTIQDIYHAAQVWYGSSDNDSVCLAECRLMRGEKPIFVLDEMDEDDYMQSRQVRVKRGSRWHGDDE